VISLLPADNPYKVLGVESNATEAEIKQAYFALVREHSPERDPEGFKRIRAAYEKLRAGGERAETDLFLIDEESSPDATVIQKFSIEPQSLTPEIIRVDLLALEGEFLLEKLRT
jgi:curved DNA-binding protein CbpA